MVILDTHVVVWMDQNHEKLGNKARKRIDKALKEDELFTVAISYWEMAMLVAKKRVTLAQPLLDWRRDLLRGGLKELAVDGAIGIAAAQLRAFHGDPADRLIVATSRLRGAHLMTADERILTWKGPLNRLDARQ